MMFSAGFGQGLLVDTTALAAVALLGYIFGRQRRPRTVFADDPQLREELSRAQRIADEFERAAGSAAIELRTHARAVAAYQSQLAAMERGADAEWRELRSSADKLVSPTLKLITNLTLACHQLRRQQTHLCAFSGSRIDPATRLQNRRALEEQLEAFFSIHAVGKRRFALALFSVTAADADDAHSSDESLRRVARLLEECIRDDDVVARYSRDEFVVLMPQTALAGALAFSERLLVQATADLSGPLWGGVVEATSDESPTKLLSRADSALYSARAAGEASLFYHNGVGVRRHAVSVPAAAADNWQHEPLTAAIG